MTTAAAAAGLSSQRTTTTCLAELLAGSVLLRMHAAAPGLQVCRLARLTFDPPLLYCNTCGSKIKRGAPYYSTPVDTQQEFRGTWCSQCFNETKGEHMQDHTKAKKADLQVGAVLRWRVQRCMRRRGGTRTQYGEALRTHAFAVMPVTRTSQDYMSRRRLV